MPRGKPAGSRANGGEDEKVDEPAGDLDLLVLTDDLFLVPRFEDAARSLGGRARFVGAPGDLGVRGAAVPRRVPLTEPLEGAEAELVRRIAADRPSLILVDLTTQAIPWESWIQVLKTSAATRRIPIVAFGPHVEDELLRRAREAGADEAITRGRLHASLQDIVEKWAKRVDFAALARGCREPLSPETRLGIEQLNREEFFKAHETLEHAWTAESGPGREVLRSLIQVAVAYLQVQRGNLRGAQKILLRLRQWLDPLPSPCRGVDIAALRDQMEAFRAALGSEDPPTPTELIRAVFHPIAVAEG
jgi:CheY-like chemotaxis protein